jgi:hypothetical protein
MRIKMTDETEDKPLEGELVRDDKGRFLKGTSGNPAGKPKGSKNHLVALRRNTEVALREYMSTPENAKKALKALDALFTQAADGELAAMKLLFDKILPQARAGSDEGEGEKQRPVAIQIVNQTSDKATSPVTIRSLGDDDDED